MKKEEPKLTKSQSMLEKMAKEMLWMWLKEMPWGIQISSDYFTLYDDTTEQRSHAVMPYFPYREIESFDELSNIMLVRRTTWDSKPEYDGARCLILSLDNERVVSMGSEHGKLYIKYMVFTIWFDAYWSHKEAYKRMLDITFKSNGGSCRKSMESFFKYILDE